MGQDGPDEVADVLLQVVLQVADLLGPQFELGPDFPQLVVLELEVPVLDLLVVPLLLGQLVELEPKPEEDLRLQLDAVDEVADLLRVLEARGVQPLQVVVGEDPEELHLLLQGFEQLQDTLALDDGRPDGLVRVEERLRQFQLDFVKFAFLG